MRVFEVTCPPQPHVEPLGESLQKNRYRPSYFFIYELEGEH